MLSCCPPHHHHLPLALQAALQLAEEISSFPQQCLRADRSSAIYSSYDAPSFMQVKLSLLRLARKQEEKGGGATLLRSAKDDYPHLLGIIPGDAVRDGSREARHPGGICHRRHQVHLRSRKRRKILLGLPLAAATPPSSRTS